MAGPMKGSTRHRWSYAEMRMVVERAAELRRETPTLSMLDAARAAQDALPEERRKTKVYNHNLKQALKRDITAVEEKRRHEALPIAAEPAPIATEPPATEPPSLNTLLRDLGSALGAALAQELGPMFVQAMKAAFTAQIDDRIPEAMIDFEKYEGKAVRPRVAIVGLLGPQRRTIEESFPHVDIRWLDNAAPNTTVRTVTGTCDEVYLMTKFIRHHTQHGVAREKRVMINGGVTDLARVLQQRYQKPNGNSAAAHH